MGFYQDRRNSQPVKSIKKFTASVSLFLFLLNQMVPPAVSSVMTADEKTFNMQAVSLQDAAQEKAPSTEPSLKDSTVQTTQDFLSLAETLKAASKEEESSEARTENETRDYPEEYSFDEALDQLVPDYASAVIVKSVTAEDLQKLTELQMEVGFAVVKGKLVLFTSGNEDEIRVLGPVKNLLDQADFFGHVHPAGQRGEPSLTDFAQAGSEVEYVISEDGVYSYNQDGLTQQEPLSYETLSDKISKALNPDAPSAETRDLLNLFIQAIDEYNLNPDAASQWRSADPPTVLPGFPVIGFFNGGGAPFMSQWNSQPQSATQIRLDYDVRVSGSFQGSVINFGASPNGAQNLSALSKLTFEMRSDNVNCSTVNCFKVEVKDTAGRVASVFIKGLTTTFQQVDIPKATLQASNPNLDFTAIKEIVFVVDRTLAGTPKTGFLEVNTAGISFNGNKSPDAAITVGQITPAPANSQGAAPVLTGFASFTAGTDPLSTTSVNMLSKSQASLTFTHNTTNSFGGVFLDYDNLATNDNNAATTTDLESINLNTAFSNGLILELATPDSTVTSVKLEVTDVNGKKDYVTLSGITNTAQRWKVLANEFQEVDVTKIKTLALVVTGQRSNHHLDVRWGDFFFVPVFNPDPAVTAANVTKVPATSLGERPTLTAFNSVDLVNDPASSTSVTMLSQTSAQLVLNHFKSTTFGGVFLNYDNAATNDGNAATTADIETINLNTLFAGGIKFGLQSPNSAVTQINLEVTDIAGNKDSVVLNGITNTLKFWNIAVNAFDGVDLTKIQNIALVETGANRPEAINNGLLNVQWGDFAFVPALAPDAAVTAADVTLVPANSLGERPVLTGFASVSANDPFSSTSVNMQSKKAAQLVFNHFTTESSGGIFIDYDNIATTDGNPATTTDIESINLSTVFANGIKFGLRSAGGGITQVNLEVTDVTGKRDSILLTGIGTTEKFWNVSTALFDQVDLTKIKSLALVVNGVHVGHDLLINWGDFTFVPALNADTALTQADITPVPATSQGLRPALTGFNSPNSASDPFSSTNLTMLSKNTGQLTLNHYQGDTFGGAFFGYDNPATNDSNPATITDIETINLNTAFANGMKLGLLSPNSSVTSVTIEVTDANGNKDSIALNGLTNALKIWNISPALFDQVDVTKIQSITILEKGSNRANALNGGLVNIVWGDFIFTPGVNPNPALTAADVTLLPLDSTGARRPLRGFASFNANDLYSSTTVTTSSTLAAQLVFNHFTTESFGGGFVNYDNPLTDDNNPATTTDIETINLNTLFANGIKFGLKSPGGGITKVNLELTDINGAKDSVLISGITNADQFWSIGVNLFDQVDVTKVRSIALVVDGVHIGHDLNVQWGTFDHLPGIIPDPALTTADITKVPALSTGGRPTLTGFASFSANDQFSSVTANQLSKTFANLTFNTFTTDSFGGSFLSYDDLDTNDSNPATTADIETINLSTAFPNGIKFLLDSPGGTITEASFEVTDITGKKDSVQLKDIKSFGQIWNIAPSAFDQVDITKIQSIALVVTGVHVGHQLNVDWGDFQNTPSAGPDLALTTADITKVPALSTGDRPTFTGFASFNANDQFSTSTVNQLSKTFANVTLNTFTTASFGGAFLNYDNPLTNDNNAATTADIETINLNTAFASGIKFAVDSPGGTISTARLEVTDINGKKDSILLTGIEATGHIWNISPAAFDQVDATKIQSIALVVDGRHVGHQLNVDWGDFQNTPGLLPDGSLTSADITKVPALGNGGRPTLTGFASLSANDPFSSVSSNQLSQTFANLNFNLFNTESFGGAFLSYDDTLTNDNNPATTADIETINLNTAFPAGIKFLLDSPGGTITEASFEVTDITGKKDSVKLLDIKSFGQIWNISLAALDQVDLTKIQSLAIVVNGKHVGHQLNVDWGNFQHTPKSTPDLALTTADITKVPALSTGDRPTLTGFASFSANDQFSSSSVNQISTSFANITLNTFTTQSFGGVFLNYDNAATNDSNPVTTADIETINLNTAFSNGIKFLLDSPLGAISTVRLEMTDINGKKDSVEITGIEATGHIWNISPAAFDQVDVTKIQSMAIVADGVHVGHQLNIDWGNFAFTPSVNPDAALTVANVTKLPADSTGARPVLTGFVSSSDPNATTSLTMLSKTSAQHVFNHFTTTAFGGSFVNYDNTLTNDNNPATTADIETINLNTVFPNDIVLGLKSPGGGISKVSLEVTDITGKKDTVVISGIGTTDKFWKIAVNLFDQVDTTKIQSITLVVDGVHIGHDLTVNWGDYAFTPGIAPDAALTAADVTKLPADSTGLRPTLTGFASVSANDPNSTTALNMLSVTSGSLVFNHFTTASFGGAFVDYDNPATNDSNAATTTDIESLNLTTLFANGIKLGLRSPGAGINQVSVEVTDVNGAKDSVLLTGITAADKFWNIPLLALDQVDLTHIRSFAVLVNGVHVGHDLVINWGDFAFTPSLQPDAALTAANITLLPLNSLNERPELAGFASFSANDQFSSASATLSSRRVADIDLNLFTTASFGGAFVNYDDPATNDNNAATTADIETINLTALFAAGIKFGLSSPNSTITGASIEVTDITGKKDSIKLSGITSTEKYWNVNPASFDQVDVTKIQSIAFIVDGIHTGHQLRVNWGEFNFVPVVTGSAFNDALLTTMDNLPEARGGAGNTDAAAGSGVAYVNQLGSTEAELEFDLSASATAFSYMTLANQSGLTANLPTNFVIAARGRQGGKVRVEIEDQAGRKATFILILSSIYQNYTLTLAGDNVPAGFDATHVVQVTLVEDQRLSPGKPQGLVQLQVKGMSFSPVIIPQALVDVKELLIDRGASFFSPGPGVDPVMHFPYDRMNSDGTVDIGQRFTQPTLIGFYAQILGESVNGKVDMGLTVDQSLAEAAAMVNSLLNVQANYGWNGLIPWMDLDPVVAGANWIGVGDNAALAQSLAVMIGALETATLTSGQQAVRAAILANVNTFLDNQKPGFHAFVDGPTGLFRNSYNKVTGQFDSYIDRLATEFRGAIAFLLVSDPTLPASIWNNLQIVFDDYIDRNGYTVRNLATYEGGAFQTFWPLLRNNERDFIQFRNALYNHLETQTDYAAKFQIPGILSASETPEGQYFGLIGVHDVAETSLDVIGDLGSTYALASAFELDPLAVLEWLDSIENQIPGLMGVRGFLDSARSNTEIADLYLGIDIGSTVIALAGNSPDYFDRYMKNRNLQTAFNALYDGVNINILKTASTIVHTPEFPDRTFAVLSNFTSEGSINSFPTTPTQPTGVQFGYGALNNGFGGQFWNLDQVVNARANQLAILYTAVDSPVSIKIELKDAADQLVYSGTVALSATNDVKMAVLDLPNETLLENVQKVFVIIDQNATGDTGGDFLLQSINFRHFVSSQTLQPNSSLTAADLSTLPDSPQAQYFSSGNPGGLTRDSQTVTTLNYDVTSNGFAGFSINFDPLGTNTDGTDLSGLTDVTFGLKSSKVKKVKIEIDDVNGKRAILYASDIDSTQRYYQFLSSLLAASVDLTKVKRINFVVDQTSVSSGDEIGSLQFDINGLQFP